MLDDLPHSTRRLVHRVANQFQRQSKQPLANKPDFSVIWGVVDSIDTSSTPHTLGVKLQGSATPQTGIKFLSSYSPTVGDTVMAHKNGRDLVVMGGMSGVTNSTTIQIPQTYAVLGSIAAESLPIFYVPVPSYQKVKLIGIRAKVATGTSVNIDVQQNGSGVTGLTSLTVNTTSTSHTLGTALACADNDEFGVVINSVSGTPGVLSCSFFFAVMS